MEGPHAYRVDVEVMWKNDSSNIVASFPVPRPAFRRCLGRGTGNEATNIECLAGHTPIPERSHVRLATHHVRDIDDRSMGRVRMNWKIRGAIRYPVTPH